MVDEEIYQKYLNNLLEGKEKKCTEIVNSLLEEEIRIKELYVNLIQRSMYKVGELWENGKISVADEHIATSITERILTLVRPKIFSSTRSGKSSVVACVGNEYHQLGGRMVADIFELNNWNSYFIGANTPIKDLLDFISDKNPKILGLSLALYFNLPELLKTIKEIRKKHQNLEIFVGGQAFRNGGHEILDDFKNVKYVPSLEKLEKTIN